jgi:hypothetical protein
MPCHSIIDDIDAAMLMLPPFRITSLLIPLLSHFARHFRLAR